MKYKRLLFLILSQTSIFAQELIPGEKELNVNPILGPGVERVGNAGLPVQKLGNKNAFQENKFNKDTLPMGNNKNNYDSTTTSGRIVYLNGVNISQIKNQELSNVNVRIDANGGIYIDAPQYEVVHKQNYHPLLPNEIPKTAKEGFLSPDMPKGVYSKETGLPSTLNSEMSNPTPKPATPEEAFKNEKNLKELSDKENPDGKKPKIQPPFPKELAPQSSPTGVK